MTGIPSTDMKASAASVGRSRPTLHRRRPASPLPALLDVEGVAEVLGVGIRQIRRLVDQRRIPFVKVGHYVRFDPREITVGIDERRVPEGGHSRFHR